MNASVITAVKNNLDLSQNVPLKVAFYEALRKTIILSEIPAGCRINEKELASALNISRTPIRYALGVLEEEKLVEHIPKRGIVVRGISLKDAIEIFDIRKALDTLAATKAMYLMTDKDFADMKKILTVILIFCIYVAVPAVITLSVNSDDSQGVSQENIYGPRVNVKYKNGTKSVSVNEYVTMVLAKRFESGDETETLKAMGIMIRTDIYRVMGDEMSVDSETLGMEYFTKNVMKNEWGNNFEEYYNHVNDSVMSTGQMVITYNNNLIDAKYSRVCNEKTLSGTELLGADYAYLVPADCPEDMTSPDFLKTEEYSKKQFVKKINTAYKDSGLDENNPFGDIQVVSQTNMGYVTKIQVGNVVMSGDVFAKILGLNSPFFAIKDGKITTKGKGSGFGVSLYTANIMARSGSTYEDIINKFYSGVAIVSR